MNRRDESNKIINEIDSCLNLLYNAISDEARLSVLNHIKCKVYDLYLVNSLESYSITADNSDTSPDSRFFTVEELAYYDGKDGKPSYVAVNGIVYDVTGNVAWSSSKHFGLTAGKDWSPSFNSCHAVHPVLHKLPVAGKMI